MQATASTSTHSSPSRPVHRRQRSSQSSDVQDANVAGRPFAFVPKRKPCGGSPVPALRIMGSEEPNPGHVQIVLSEEPDVPSLSISRAFVTFPRAKSDPVHARLPRFEEPNETASLCSPISDVTTPTNARAPKGVLLLDLDSRTYCASAAASTQADTAASLTIAGAVTHCADAGPCAAFTAALIRKKSGELLKPSLKSSTFATWSTASRARTKSAPSTPVGPKFVHFDAKLEHVKLFLAEQKPLAVSRDGSPTETSEGETDTCYPFPPMSTPLCIKSIALPPPLGASWTFDVQLEQVALEDAALVGHVLVRNVAFSKRVAARFTFDAWQTTSEVAAKHLASVREGDFDRFEFRIRIIDYLRDIESKRLVMCLKYSVEGREMWDNNAGRNYEVGFERVREVKKATVTTTVAKTSQRDLWKSGLDSMSDLRKQLEKVVQDVDGPPPPLAVRKGARVWISGRDLGDEDPSMSPPRIRSRSPSPLGDKAATPSLRDVDAPLSARYDFSSSLKSPVWKPPPEPSAAHSAKAFMPKQTRLRAKRTLPATTPMPVPDSQLPDADEHRRSMAIPVDNGFTSRPCARLPHGSPRDFSEEDDRSRHHTRAWTQRMSYFDRVVEDAPALKKTPPGTPIITAATPTSHRPPFRLSSRTSSSSSSSSSTSSETRSPSVSPNNAFLALDSVRSPFQPDEDESVASTPSITTSASSPSLSPVTPIGHLPRSASDDSVAVGAIAGMSRAKRPPVNSTPYHSFLDQFCFFTGVDSPRGYTHSHQNGIAPRRTHSASSVEDYFSISPPLNEGSHSPYGTLRSPTSGHTTPTRSPISSDFTSHRGFATPRPGTPNEFTSSTVSTPVAG